MIIDGLRRDATDTEAEVSARLVWEDVDRKPQMVHFRVPRRFEGLLWTGLEPFLCAAVVPAMAAGEARIHSVEPVCPVLVEGIETAVFWLRKWYPSRYPRAAPVLSLPKLRTNLGESARATGLFLSGGVDSLYSLRRNAECIPSDHPARVRYAITVFGFDIGGKRHEVGSTVTGKPPASFPCA